MAEIAGIVSGIIVLTLLFKPFFGTAGEFWECIRFWVTPDLFSWFTGEYWEDWMAEMKLGLWLACGGGTAFGIMVLIEMFSA